MIQKFNKLSNLWKTTIISILISLFLFLVFIPFVGFGLLELSLGFLLGGSMASLCFLLFSLTEKDDDKKGMIKTIILIIFMFLIHALTLLLSVLLYYKVNAHLFNIFATFGGLFIPTIVFAIINLIDGRKANAHGA